MTDTPQNTGPKSAPEHLALEAEALRLEAEGHRNAILHHAKSIAFLNVKAEQAEARAKEYDHAAASLNLGAAIRESLVGAFRTENANG